MKSHPLFGFRSVALAVGFVAGMFFVGCEAQPEPASSGTGKVKLLVTDKPFPFELIEEASITVTRVEAHFVGMDDDADGTDDDGDGTDDDMGGTDDDGDGTTDHAKSVAAAKGDDDLAGTDDDDDGTDEDGGESPWKVLFEGEETFNLLDFKNGVTGLLVDAEVESGCYNQIRIYVTAGKAVLSNGKEFELKVPSGAQSGIKLHFKFKVEAGDLTTLLLDVDVSEAFKPIPGGHIDDADQIKSFKFHPSFAMRLINLIDAGSISGVVTADGGGALGNASVTAYKDGEEVTSTSTESDGSYMLMGLPPGTYTVEFSASGHMDAEVMGVVVESGADTPGVDAALVVDGA
jgi:hypothetical protein